MWLSLMYFWYQVTMPPKGHLRAFQVSAGAVFVLFTVALVVNSVRSGIAQSKHDRALMRCTTMIHHFVNFINSVVMIPFTGFVGWRVSSRLHQLRDVGKGSASSMRMIGVIFLYCCAAFA